MKHKQQVIYDVAKQLSARPIDWTWEDERDLDVLVVQLLERDGLIVHEAENNALH